MEKDIKEKNIKKADKYDDHIEVRYHKAKKDILPQLDAIIKVNLNLNEACDEICAKYEILPSTFKNWVNDQVPSILHMEPDDSAIDEDDEDEEIED